MPILLLLLIGGAGAFVLMKGSSSSASETDAVPTFLSTDSGASITTGGFADVDPGSQGGTWKIDFDSSFKKASDQLQIPFALIKAHAIRESSLDSHAYRQEPAHGSRPPSASYGLTQILWWQGSNRFASYGYSDDYIGDGSVLYDPDVNSIIGASIMKENLNRFGNLRDAINAYNTGVAESEREAPNNYVNDVLSYYSTLVGESVT